MSAQKMKKHKFYKEPKASRRSWNDTYLELVEYQKQHGDCNVPYRGHGPLGAWVTKQKRIKEKLSPEQREKLDSIGFNWNKLDQAFEDRWWQQFNKLKKYKILHGHCNITVTNHQDDPSLGGWVSSQRGLYNKGKLREDREKLLSELGLTWREKDPGNRSTRHADLAFQDMYDRLVAFHEANDHCLVPCEYPEDRSLASFVANQRTKYRNQELPQKRIDMLESLGFVWKVDYYSAEASLHQQHWEEMFSELCRFKREHGHTQVSKGTPPEGYHPKLGQWVGMQRVFYRQGDRFMTEERCQKLNSIDFWWGSPGNNHENEPVLEKSWDDMFKQLAEFHRQHGHTVVNTTESSFGKWVVMQRVLNNKNKLRQDRRDRLDSLGFVWLGRDGRLDQQRMTKYEKLRKFHQENGHTCVPSTYSDRSLAGWVSKQRIKASDTEYMTVERKRLLDRLCFTWEIG